MLEREAAAGRVDRPAVRRSRSCRAAPGIEARVNTVREARDFAEHRRAVGS